VFRVSDFVDVSKAQCSSNCLSTACTKLAGRSGRLSRGKLPWSQGEVCL